MKVYDKQKMNGKYQVGSGRIVTVTHDTPFIDNNVLQGISTVNDSNSLKLYRDVGYHDGDLGKTEYFRIQNEGQGTGHFGTGTYLVGDKAKVEKDSYYGKRPQHAVDFSMYKLFKVSSNDEGYRLHDALKYIDGSLQEAMDGEFIDKDKSGEVVIVSPIEIKFFL